MYAYDCGTAAKYKHCQHHLGSTLPNLILAKDSCYMYIDIESEGVCNNCIYFADMIYFLCHNYQMDIYYEAHRFVSIETIIMHTHHIPFWPS